MGIDLNAAAERVIQNRKRRGFPSAHDLTKTVKGLREEVQEFTDALESDDIPEQIDGLIDVMVYCLGGLRILGCDVEKELLAVLDANERRSYRRAH